MKKTLFYIGLLLVLIGGFSCGKIDDYPAPAETLTGSVIDSVTGQPIQVEVGPGGIRVRLDELSWSDNPTPYYFYGKEDGTFNNTKLFKGRYRISVDGPFVPIIQTDNNGDTLVDKSIITNISGVTKVDFTVAPLLEVSWVNEPVITADSTITATVQFVRGTDDPAYQANVTDLYLFVIPFPYSYLGNNNFDPRYSTHIIYNGTSGNDQLGKPITIQSSGGKLPYNTSYYVRVGVRTAYGLKQYNYTTTVTVGGNK